MFATKADNLQKSNTRKLERNDENGKYGPRFLFSTTLQMSSGIGQTSPVVAGNPDAQQAIKDCFVNLVNLDKDTNGNVIFSGKGKAQELAKPGMNAMNSAIKMTKTDSKTHFIKNEPKPSESQKMKGKKGHKSGKYSKQLPNEVEEIARKKARLDKNFQIDPNNPSSKDDCLHFLFCNFCGSEVSSLQNLTSFIELNEVRLKRFKCLTCHQRYAPADLSNHEKSCRLSLQEVYFIQGIKDIDFDYVAQKFRMKLCRNCSESVKSGNFNDSKE